MYFNLYVYGTGHENTTVEFKVYEYDHKTFINQDSVEAPIKNREDIRYALYQEVDGTPVAKTPYDQSVYDGYIYDQEVTWTGWKLVSIPYSYFRPANDFLTGGGGDRIKESWRIYGMAISLLSYPSTGFYTETYIDQLVITQGGRFQK